MKGHGRAKNCQPLVETQHFLLVQPEQGALNEFAQIRRFGGD